jgi:hypothetical protein
MYMKVVATGLVIEFMVKVLNGTFINFLAIARLSEPGHL